MNEKIATLRKLFQIMEQAEASIQALLDGTAEPTISGGTQGFIGVKKKGRKPKEQKLKKRMGRPKKEKSDNLPPVEKVVKKCRCKDCNATFFTNKPLQNTACPDCSSNHVEIAE
jgi:hypothetical protein